MSNFDWFCFQKMSEYITDDTEISSDSDREILMEKFQMEKILAKKS